jgi:hypothetical protein
MRSDVPHICTKICPHFDRPSVTHRGDLIRRAMEPVIPDRIAEEVRSVAERA